MSLERICHYLCIVVVVVIFTASALPSLLISLGRSSKCFFASGSCTKGIIWAASHGTKMSTATCLLVVARFFHIHKWQFFLNDAFLCKVEIYKEELRYVWLVFGIFPQHKRERKKMLRNYKECFCKPVQRKLIELVRKGKNKKWQYVKV